MGNIKELGQHTPTVASVISRLVRHQDKIEHLTVIIDWEGGQTDIFGDDKTCQDLAWHQTILTKALMEDID